MIRPVSRKRPQRCVAPESLETTYALLREHCASGSPCLAWIGLYRPDEQEIAEELKRLD